MTGISVTYKDGLSDDGGFNRYGPSPYYDLPAELEILVEADWGGDWEYDKIVVWRHKETHELRGAYDEGCSCPTPFADLTWDTMRKIESTDDLKPLFASLCHYEDRDEPPDDDPKKADLIMAVGRALPRKSQRLNTYRVELAPNGMKGWKARTHRIEAGALILPLPDCEPDNLDRLLDAVREQIVTDLYKKGPDA